EALEITKELLKEFQLELHPEKTKVTNFSEGFKYLGYIFLNSLIVPSTAKSKNRIILNNKKKGLSVESLTTIDELTKKERIYSPVENELTEGKLKSSTLGEAFLKALNDKKVSLNQFLELQTSKEKIAEIPVEAEIEKELCTEEYEIEDESVYEGDKVDFQIPPQVTSMNRTLYIQEQGSIIKKESERIIITKDGTELLELPAIKVSQIIIFGNCTISPAVMHYCLMKKIPIILLSSRGKYYGTLESTFSNDAENERLQLFRTLDSNITLSFTKEIITSKINNQRTLLQRYARKLQDEKITHMIEQLGRIIKRIEKCASIDDVRGYEGVAAVSYFKAYGRLFNKEKGFYTEKFLRTKRPPLDPVNSLLSFGYTLLASNIYSFVKVRGLSPYCGFFHAIRSGHPALVSDLIEEFRFLVDIFVLHIMNHKILSHNDFYFAKEPNTPCYLTNNARKIFIKHFELKMHQKVNHEQSGYKVDYRRCLDLQVQQLLQYLRDEIKYYSATKLKT
ncbi:MAG: CRISPR-associated endonuclease Cas1, partial [Bacteroidota bacterium]|nr:CRISPR-associated endonuclease Cas1 [Bacteroidota bacterium]